LFQTCINVFVLLNTGGYFEESRPPLTTIIGEKNTMVDGYFWVNYPFK